MSVPHYSIALPLVTMCQNARSLDTKTASFSSFAMTVSNSEEQFQFREYLLSFIPESFVL
jgi:hypothetical protein